MRAPVGPAPRADRGGGALTAEYKRARLRALKRIQEGVETFEEFVARVRPDYMPVPRHLKPLYDLVNRSRYESVRAVVSMPPRHGKALESLTKILTPRGWRTHGDLRVGDDVFAPDGSTTRVVYVSPDVEIDQLITFDDGEQIKANGQHRWTVLRRGAKAEEVMDTDAMIAAGVMTGKEARPRFSVCYTSPLKGRHAALPFEPWLMGYWLGNGSVGSSRVTAGPADAVDVEAELVRRGHRLRARYTHATTKCIGMVVDDDRWKQISKRIPVEYLVASLEQRRALMTGLVDSDGSVEPETGRVRYVTTLPELAADVSHLVSTLGYRPSTTEQEPHTGFAQGRHVIGKLRTYTVQWTPHDGVAPGTLPRKQFANLGVRRRRSIVSIEKLATPTIGQCIQVDHPEHLYLVGDRLVPTHNTETLRLAIAYRCLYDPACLNAYATFASDLSEETGREVRNLCRQIGVQVGRVSERSAKSGSGKVLDWKTAYGGGLKSTSVGGSITGRGINGLLIIDDPIKGSATAMSLLERNRVWNWLRADVLSRLQGGGSCIIVQTRWHEDDPIGRILEAAASDPNGEALGEVWTSINLPAVGDLFGNPVDEKLEPLRAMPLWDSINDRYPHDSDAAMRWYRVSRARGEYEWWSLYQGVPRSADRKVFSDGFGHFQLPLEWKGKRGMIMLDPAATARTSADYSALGAFAMDGYGESTVMYVAEVQKYQMTIPNVIREAAKWMKRYGLPIGVEAVAAFKVIPDTLVETFPKLRRRIVSIIPKGDKFQRAIQVSNAWNSGRVLLPMGLDTAGQEIDPGWDVDEYVRVMCAFTGLGDKEDDVVDVTAHAWNRMYKEVPQHNRNVRTSPYGG